MAHPGYTKTNLQSAGAALGSGRTTMMARITNRFDILPSQAVETGAEPMLVAATDPAAANGELYGPGGRFTLVGEAVRQRPYRAAGGPTLARSLWAVAADITGTGLPA